MSRPRPPRPPVPRSRSGAYGRHHPRTGTEPATAQSALRLRLLLTAVFLPLFVAATVGFAVWAARSGPGDSPGSGVLTGLAVGCGVLALIAALDGAVVLRRTRRERGSPGR
ncbi:DUF6343 family protein [Streptomyces sp. B93]|uniref:DUF6343 family protein n=1 Tax=Streptomyces sp. B93 TaxID=2824875 RepID=UPI001B36F097|nr:DUF6343 family protein [Streptomyces sp. B93]MBQ1092997.1 hypothetical protein [Streptomyces sp. B93]